MPAFFGATWITIIIDGKRTGPSNGYRNTRATYHPSTISLVVRRWARGGRGLLGFYQRRKPTPAPSKSNKFQVKLHPDVQVFSFLVVSWPLPFQHACATSWDPGNFGNFTHSVISTLLQMMWRGYRFQPQSNSKTYFFSRKIHQESVLFCMDQILTSVSSRSTKLQAKLHSDLEVFSFLALSSRRLFHSFPKHLWSFMGLRQLRERYTQSSSSKEE